MKRVRQTLWVGIVWLTAAGTLVAGLPRASCLCVAEPASSAKHAGQAGCCCTTGCGASEAACPFCTPRDESPDEQAGLTAAAGVPVAPVLKTVPCRQGVIQSEAAWTPAKAHTDQAESVVRAAPLALNDAHLSSFAWNSRDSREIHLLPPPTDLVTVLQHFLI